MGKFVCFGADVLAFIFIIDRTEVTTNIELEEGCHVTEIHDQTLR